MRPVEMCLQKHQKLKVSYIFELLSLLVRHIIIILPLLFSQKLFGQIKFGTYSQIDTTLYANLELYSNKKFDFYDTRDSSCWVWTHFIGDWALIKDTIIFSWQSKWTENPDSIIVKREIKSNNVEVQFLYDNGKPVPNVKMSLSCLSDKEKYYFSNTNGKAIIPKITCPDHDRMFHYEIKNKTIKLSSTKSIDYFTDSLSNIFTIIIKRKTKSFTTLETKKYLLQGDTLLYIDRKEYYDLNWGDFKYK